MDPRSLLGVLGPPPSSAPPPPTTGATRGRLERVKGSPRGSTSSSYGSSRGHGGSRGSHSSPSFSLRTVSASSRSLRSVSYRAVASYRVDVGGRPRSGGRTRPSSPCPVSDSRVGSVCPAVGGSQVGDRGGGPRGRGDGLGVLTSSFWSSAGSTYLEGPGGALDVRFSS